MSSSCPPATLSSAFVSSFILLFLRTDLPLLLPSSPSFLTSDICLCTFTFPAAKSLSPYTVLSRSKSSSWQCHVSLSMHGQVLHRGLHCLKPWSPPTHCNWPLSPICNDLPAEVSSSLQSAICCSALACHHLTPGHASGVLSGFSFCLSLFLLLPLPSFS